MSATEDQRSRVISDDPKTSFHAAVEIVGAHYATASTAIICAGRDLTEQEGRDLREWIAEELARDEAPEPAPPVALIYPEGSNVGYTLQELRNLVGDPTYLPAELRGRA